MKLSGFWLVFVVAGMGVACLTSSISGGGGALPDPSLVKYEYVTGMNQGGFTLVVTSRKLKEQMYGTSNAMGKSEMGGIYTEDYPRFDPTPSSKAAVKAGPIEHGTPLMPYVPRPTPPDHPRHGIP